PQLNSDYSSYPTTTTTAWEDVVPYSTAFAPPMTYGLDMSFDDPLSYGVPMEYSGFEPQYTPQPQLLPSSTAGPHVSVPSVVSDESMINLPFSEPSSQYLYAQPDLSQ